MAAKQGDRRLSAGTVIGPMGAIKVLVPRWRKDVQAADAAAVDRGETRRLLCYFRGDYGDYQRRFRGCFLDLTPGGPVVRKYLLFRLRQSIPITEAIISASLRPPADTREAFQIGANGAYGSGGPLSVVGPENVSCKTAGGVLEFVVKQTDVPLLLHYISPQARKPDR
jgi:hypothetical protein